MDVIALMRSVAASSDEASALVNDLVENHSSELNSMTIDALRQRIDDLRSQVSALQTQLRTNNMQPLSDDDRAQIYHQLEKRIRDMTLDGMRSAYGEAGLKELESNELRFLVCRALCSELEARQLPIDSIWVDTLVRRGNM